MLCTADRHGQARPPSQRIVQKHLRLLSDLYGMGNRHERPQNDLAFHPRDRLAHTTVDPVAKADVAECLALNIETVWLIPSPWVSIGCSQE